MEFNFKNKTFIISALIACALIAAAAIQYQLFQKAMEANRSVFSNRMKAVAHDAARYINKRMSILVLDSAYTFQNKSLINSRTLFIQNQIDSALRDNAMPIEFQFAVYFHTERKNDAQYKYAFGNLGSKIELNACQNEISKELNYITWFLQDSHIYEDGHYDLLIHFPNKSQYLISQVTGLILVSIIISLILAWGFIYLLRTIARQRKISEIKNDFINNLTHEFKTPLFSIALANKLLKKNTINQNTQENLKYVSIIENENNRLLSQVDKILQVALIDADSFYVENKQVDMHKLITEVAKSFELAINERKGILKLSLRATNAHVIGDEVHLKNMIYNLLDNALKYSREIVDIAIHTDNDILQIKNKDTQHLIIRISDKGIGMNREVQKNVFEKFYRAERGNIHTVKGFGLGLSYVKSITEAHKATINVHSKSGEGTTFTIILPI
ncbi:MAG: sensor histidine kinase [Pseudomonadota bacterium]|jgi:signal transduction histidine kinase